MLFREIAAPGGLIRRVGRAVRLGPSLYREVAGPGVCIWQAVLVAVLTAAASGIAWDTEASLVFAIAEPAFMDLRGMRADVSVPAGVRALADLAA